MKKLIALILSLTLVLVLVGCKDKTIKGSELYSFPEPTIHKDMKPHLRLARRSTIQMI